MMKSEDIYAYLAAAIDYPEANYLSRLAECQSLIKAHYPELTSDLSSLLEFVAKTEFSRVEEAYTTTFDIHAVCHLDVGYQLFGEDYKRGALLVELGRVHKQAGHDTGSELGDHLRNLLRVLPKIADEEERSELARKLILPAMKKMMASFPEDSPNVYRSVLSAIYGVLETDFGPAEEFPKQQDYSAEVPVETEGGGSYV